MNPIAHLTPEDIEAFGRELDAIRDEVRADLGEDDANYIRNVIKAHRALEAAGRGTLLASLFPPAWIAGTTMLSVAKILENMEIGHNVMHGQWDWMRDPEIHSTNWEWDSASTAEAWKHSHNNMHHTWTNVVDKDRDLGYAIMRVDPEQPWHPVYLAQPFYNFVLAAFFEYGVALHDIEFDSVRKGTKEWSQARAELGEMWRKIRRQMGKDYVLFPLLSGPSALTTLTANATSNVVRNVWAHTIIFCGHFPDGAETFTLEDIEGETRGGWYLRQLLGSCNLDGGNAFHMMAGNLSFQIEHHLFPDLPSNRYKQISPRVQEICKRYGLPYNTGPLGKQYFSVLKKIARYALPGGAPSPSPSAASATSGRVPAAVAA